MRSLASFAPVNRSPVPLSPRSALRSGIRMLNRGGADQRRQMEVYGEDGVVYPIVRRLAEAVAAQEWKLYTRAATPEERTQVTSHAVLDLLERPNKFMSRMQLMEAGQQHSDLTGETNLVLGYEPGIRYPIDLWPVRPDRLTPVPDPRDFLTGWIYRLGNEVVPLELNEIIRHILPSPLDPYRGMGPIQALMRDLDAQRYGKEWQAAFFANSARPGGIIEVDRRLSDDEFNEMRDRWAEQHRGLSKAHRVAIIEHGAKWNETSFSLRDLQMAELETVGRDKALVAFGFPKSMLGIVEDVNRANAEAGEYMFARWLVKPRLDRWRGMFNRQLLPLLGPDVPRRFELDYESPVPENSEQALAELETKSQAVIDLVAAGFGVEQVLELVGWPTDLPYTAPPPPTVIAPPGRNAPQPEEEPEALAAGVDAAMRWQVVGERDGNACAPCKKNHGKLYRNRSSAYADYPGGKGYIRCVGAQFGNECRCKVVKRRSK